MSNGKSKYGPYSAGGETSKNYGKYPLYVKEGGTATGKIGDYEHFSKERIAEYKARGWAMDHTTHKPHNPNLDEVVVTGKMPEKKTPSLQKTAVNVVGGEILKNKDQLIKKASKDVAGKAVSEAGKGLGSKLKEKMGGGGAGGFAQIAQGLAKTAGSLIGGGKRRREQRAANKELAQRKQAYEDFEMKNVHADATNPYEDLKVNTQEAEFMAQQSQQGLANTLGSLSATAGGSGIAALAQTMAGQQAMNIQRAGASIGMQESRNEAMRAQGEERRQVRMAQGAADVQQFELGRTETLFDMAATRKKEADAARAKATQDLVGGIADVAVGVGRVAVGGA